MDELREKFALHEQPGIICLQKVDETDKAAYLVRQYFAYNLYDRFHTHPFLTDIEKKWFAFQLLTAVTQVSLSLSLSVLCAVCCAALATNLRPRALAADEPAPVLVLVWCGGLTHIRCTVWACVTATLRRKTLW